MRFERTAYDGQLGKVIVYRANNGTFSVMVSGPISGRVLWASGFHTEELAAKRGREELGVAKYPWGDTE